ncbi:hypothetical protein [Mesorhizobium sp. SARCC-RB16n]|uniref:hypothetical protein n=1 Tax=Mesorhizobium sp. SARCC-RB16n TaxID=2116687 RepID=UPI00122F866A|nr:hypothetical protein [Mesorhizobium sp. SARCC-RB16n]
MRLARILAKIALGALLVSGSATVSIARGGGSDGHGIDFSGRGTINSHRHHEIFFSDPGYHYQPWWNYDTDAAYCSFDAVNSSYYGSSGMWHSCP